MFPLSRHFSTDSREDCVFSLEAAGSFLESSLDNPQWWKWVVLAIHSALQGALALCLERGNRFAVQKPSVGRKMMEAHASGSEWPDPYMDSMLNLFKRAREPGAFNNERSLRCSEAQVEMVTRLDETRHDFVHFNCVIWLIEHEFLTSSICGVLPVIRELLQSQHFAWSNLAQEQRAAAAIDRLELVMLRHAS